MVVIVWHVVEEVQYVKMKLSYSSPNLGVKIDMLQCLIALRGYFELLPGTRTVRGPIF